VHSPEQREPIKRPTQVLFRRVQRHAAEALQPGLELKDHASLQLPRRPHQERSLLSTDPKQ